MAMTDIRRCGGLAGLLFGHKFEEMVDEEYEYYPFDPVLMRGTGIDPRGPVKSERLEHLYCICRRCGQQVQKEKRGLFAEEK